MVELFGTLYLSEVGSLPIYSTFIYLLHISTYLFQPPEISDYIYFFTHIDLSKGLEKEAAVERAMKIFATLDTLLVFIFKLIFVFVFIFFFYVWIFLF